MAASGKKKKGKGKAISLNEFLSTSSGGNAPPSNAPISWADEMEQELIDDPEADLSGHKLNMDRSILPTAPRAARGPDIDLERVPDVPPFTAFLGNLPYDVEDEDIFKFFNMLKVLNVRLPQDGGRLKGFGYAEFADKGNLLEALAMNEGQLRNRKIRIDLAGSSNEGGRDGGRDSMGGRRRDDDDGEDRTAGDWRRAPSRDDGPGGGGGSSFERRDDRGGSSFGGDRDRGFGGGGGRDRGFGDRDRGFSSYGGDRGGGFGGDRDGDSSGRRGFGSGYNRDGGGGGGSSFGGDRYGGDRDRGFGGDSRRAYSPPRERFTGKAGGYGGRDGSPPSAGPPRERPKMNLQPRSKPAESADSGRSSIFGDAKPVDTTRFDDMSRSERMKDGKEAAPKYQPPSEDRRDNRDYPPRDPPREPPRDGDRRSNPDEAANKAPPGERPRLNLQKRSKPLEDDSNKGPGESKASIFGAAKPVNTAAREREIEERLQREREFEQQDLVEKDNKERRLSSTDQGPRSSRSRKDSNNSSEGGDKRTRKLSSSSSGKGIRTVAPPPGVGSARIRRDSTLSDHEDNVFDEEHGKATSPPASKSPKSPSATEEDTPPKMVPAPPPKENIWEKRKQVVTTSPPSKSDAPLSPPAASQPPPSDRRPSQEDKTKDKENVVPAPAPTQNAWKKGKPDLVPATPPKENPWDKRKQEQQTKPAGQRPGQDHDDLGDDSLADGSLPPDSAWARGKPRTEGPSRGRGGGGGRGRGGESKPRARPEKTLPQSIDEMPKAEDLAIEKKDLADSNKFAMLLDEEDAAISD